ncbi:MAG: M43 family zinc metalloprotease [Bacteroidota bacterium]
MRKPLTLIFFFLLVNILSVKSQSEFPCGTDELEKQLSKSNTNYLKERTKYNDQIYSILNNKRKNPSARLKTNDDQPEGVFTIPVVFHVIHIGEPLGTVSNISDEQIVGALRGLNRDWRNRNENGVDLEIEFALAKRDPNGNQTSGINRVDGSQVPKYLSAGMHYTDTLGANHNEIKKLSKWPRDRYINIWIVKIYDICGYANYPSSYDFEGIVMNHYCLSEFDATFSHEMGHFFNLRHTFDGDNAPGIYENGLVCPADNDCLLEGDQVCDTPPHKKNDCQTSECSSMVDFQNSASNFMSYCGSKTRFTGGQKDRVRAAMYSEFRWPLVKSEAIIPIDVQEEVGIISFAGRIVEKDYEYPFEKKPICNGTIPEILIKNLGTNTIQSLKIEVMIDNEIAYYQNLNSSISKNETVSLLLKSLNYNDLNNHSIKVKVVKINDSETDFLKINNEISTEFSSYGEIVKNKYPITFKNADDFIKSNNFDKIPEIITNSACLDSNVLKFNTFYTGNEYNYQLSEVFLPPFSLDSVFNAYIVFDHAYRKGAPNSFLSVQLYAFADCDLGKKYIGSFASNSNILETVEDFELNSSWLPSCNDWRKDSLSIRNLTGKNVLPILLINRGGNTQNLFLRNFRIFKQFNIEITSNDYNLGSAGYSRGLQLYNEGDSVIVSSNNYGNKCHKFIGWSENGKIITTNESYKFIATKNRKLVANYEIIKYQIETEIKPLNAGKVTGATFFECNKYTTLLATPEYGYRFVNWTENGKIIEINNEAIVYEKANHHIVANFEPLDFSVNVTNSPQKINTNFKQQYLSNQSIIADTSNNCYTFINWTQKDLVVSTNAKYSYKVESDLDFKANYDIKKYQLTFDLFPEAAGKVFQSGTFSCDTTLKLFAKAANNYVFSYWTDDKNQIISSDSNYTFKVSKQLKLTANFSLITGNEPNGSDKLNLKIYPNPSDGIFKADFTNNDSKQVGLSVYNLLGQRVWFKTIYKRGKYSEKIDLTNYPSGHYVFIIENENFKQTKKIEKY